jgi:atypical dual specificity phosphatase
MSVSHLNWRDALRVVRVGRKIANPNTGFQIQLHDFEMNKVDEERRRMKERYPSLASEF